MRKTALQRTVSQNSAAIVYFEVDVILGVAAIGRTSPQMGKSIDNAAAYRHELAASLERR